MTGVRRVEHEERVIVHYDTRAPEGAYTAYAMRASRGLAFPADATVHFEFDQIAAKDVMVFRWVEYVGVREG